MNRGCFETEYRYVDDVLSINNSYFHSYVKSLRVSAKYRKIPQILRHLFYICVFTKIKTLMVTYKQHYLINVWFCFFPSSTSLVYVASSPAYWVHVSQLIGYESACSTYKQFFKQGKLLTKKLMEQGYQEPQLKIICT